jgi:hypothetical protein
VTKLMECGLAYGVVAYRTATLHRLAESIPGLLKRLQLRGQVLILGRESENNRKVLKARSE